MLPEENNMSLASALSVLPRRLASAVRGIPDEAALEEIRLRVARPMQLITSEGEFMPETAAFTAAESAELLERICMHSVYAHLEELRSGYVTLKGGARVGVCGRPSAEHGDITNLVDIYSFNFRIARQIIGCASSVMRLIVKEGRPVSTLIAAPPGGGKTTLLRDVARCLSEGVGSLPQKVAIADERGELAACVEGAPSFDVGRRTDVMDCAPKAKSIALLVRSMSPDVVITDEIGGADDAAALAEAARCGTAIIASAHASGVEELLARGSIAPLIREGVFKRVLTVKRSGSMLHISCANV